MRGFGRDPASRLSGIGIGLLGSLSILAATGVVLAVVTLSNMLTFGPSQVGLAVALTKEKDLPSPIAIGQENEIKFRIEASQQVTDVTLWLQLRADEIALDDPASVQLSYRHPGTSSFSSVTLTPVGGVLKAPLRSGWSFPEGYDDTGNLRITFQSSALPAAYSIDLWAEGTVAAAVTSPPSTPTATPTTSQVVTDIVNFNLENLTIVTGTTVTWTNWDSADHTTTTQAEGGTSPLWDSGSLGTGESFSFTFDNEGTYAYFCAIHPYMMGTIAVTAAG